MPADGGTIHTVRTSIRGPDRVGATVTVGSYSSHPGSSGRPDPQHHRSTSSNSLTHNQFRH